MGVSGANDCLQQMLPDEKKQPMADEVGEIKTRMEILKKTDDRLIFILDFNQRLAILTRTLQSLKTGLVRAERGWMASETPLSFSAQKTALPRPWKCRRTSTRSLNSVESRRLRRQKSSPSRVRRCLRMPRSSSRG